MSLESALQNFGDDLLRTRLRNAYNEGGRMATAMLARNEMPPERALLVGLALDPGGRELVEDAFDEVACPEGDLPQQVDEVVIGGGAHAAAYAAVRTTRGYPPPLVLDQNVRFGGTFAMTQRSSFYLNSRNRPGQLGAPGSRDALNVIPGAMMQPSDLGGSEYQANADLGLVVRCTLSLGAKVRRAKVQALSLNGEQLVVETDRGVVFPKRVIVATGIGKEKKFNGVPRSKRVLGFNDFMQRFDDEMFPLRGLGRVAVVGGGDSGRTVIEALTGYGPYLGGSVASLDYVSSIDWYGIEDGMTKERWLQCNRTRYKPLSSLFPSNTGVTRNARVRGLPKLVQIFDAFSAGIQINGNYYETVIDCRGFEREWRKMFEVDEAIRTKTLGSNPDGEKGTPIAQVSEAENVFVVGPAADIAFGASDPEPRVAENNVALFRLIPRTSALAVRLPAAV